MEQILDMLLNKGKCFRCFFPFNTDDAKIEENGAKYEIRRFHCPNCHVELIIPVSKEFPVEEVQTFSIN